jgi:hypothetical protein
LQIRSRVNTRRQRAQARWRHFYAPLPIRLLPNLDAVFLRFEEFDCPAISLGGLIVGVMQAGSNAGYIRRCATRPGCGRLLSGITRIASSGSNLEEKTEQEPDY